MTTSFEASHVITNLRTKRETFVRCVPQKESAFVMDVVDEKGVVHGIFSLTSFRFYLRQGISHQSIAPIPEKIVRRWQYGRTDDV
jgi:hypothetical protein